MVLIQGNTTQSNIKNTGTTTDANTVCRFTVTRTDAPLTRVQVKSSANGTAATTKEDKTIATETPSKKRVPYTGQPFRDKQREWANQHMQPQNKKAADKPRKASNDQYLMAKADMVTYHLYAHGYKRNIEAMEKLPKSERRFVLLNCDFDAHRNSVAKGMAISNDYAWAPKYKGINQAIEEAMALLDLCKKLGLPHAGYSD